MTTYLIYYIDQIYFQNWMCVWLYFKKFTSVSFLFFVFSLFFSFLERIFFVKKKLKNLFAPPNKMYVVFLNQHLIKNGQHSKTLSSHKWFKTTHEKKIKMGKCTQIFNQWDTQKPKIFIWGDRFFEKKARHGFKARNHSLKK